MAARTRVRSAQDSDLIHHALSLSTFFGLISLAIPLLMFIGELSNIRPIVRGHPALPVLHFLTALGLVLSSIAVLLSREDKITRARSNLAKTLALFVILIGLLSYVEQLFGWDFEIIFRGQPFAENLTPLISISFMLLGSAILIYHQRRINIFFGQIFALLVVGISIFVLNRYLFTLSDIQLLPADVSSMGMSLLTASTFTLISFSILCSRPADEMMSLLTRSTKSAGVARNILITAIFAPPFIGALTRIGMKFGWYDLSVQFAIFAIVMTAIILRATWKAVKRAEEEELRALSTLDALKALNVNLKRTIQEKRLFASLVENSDDFIAIADSNEKPWYINPAGRRLIGLENDSRLVELDRLDFYPPEHREFVKNVIYKECASRGHWKGLNYLRNFKTGEIITVSDERFVICEEGTNRIIASCAICRDITEHIRREDQLRVVARTSIELARVFKYKDQEKKIARMLTPDLADGAALSIEGSAPETFEFSHVNPRFERPFKELVLKILKNEIDLKEYRKSIEQGIPVILEDFAKIRRSLAAQLKNAPELLAYLNEIRSLAFLPLSVLDRSVGSIIVVIDSSKRRFHPVDLEFFKAFSMRFAFFIENARLVKDLEEAVKVREDVLSIVSHDLKNPVAAIALAVQLLRSLKPGEINKMRELTEKIQRALDQMQNLIMGLLDFAKIRSGTFAIEAYEENLNSVIIPVVDVLRLQAEAKKQTLTLDLPFNLPMVVCDAKRIGQVVMNILGNAIKFTPEGGSIEVKARSNGQSVCVAVSDNGPGIYPEDVERIFDRFWQSRRTKSQGTGLGLAIAKGIVKAHGGEIWAESELSKGSTFYFTIPLSRAETPKKRRKEPSRMTEEAPTAKPALYGVRVLLVDDSPDMLSLLSRLLENAGATIMSATTVSQAYDMFLRERPDVILTDIEMPGESGVELIGKIQRLGPEKGGHIPIAALTAHGREEDLRKLDEAGFDLKLIKPIDIKELVAAISKLASMSRSFERSTRFKEWTESP